MSEAGRGDGHPPATADDEKSEEIPEEETSLAMMATSPGPPPPPAPLPDRTLLPPPLAGALSVSLNTTATMVRAGTWLGGVYLSIGKCVVIKSASGAQRLIRGALSLAASEVSANSSSDLHLLDTDSIVAHLLTSIHYNLSKVSFWATLGANTTQGTLEATSALLVAFLDYLNQFFGSTDSSRAMASIIAMSMREFGNPATGAPGEKVGAVTLLRALSNLAYLQNQCNKMKEEREHRASLEELLWDVVVLDDGTRIDVDGLHVTHQSGPLADQAPLRGAAEQTGMNYEQYVEETAPETAPEAALKRQIMRSLPSNASVDIDTTTALTKTITVDVKGTDVLPFNPPRGAEIVEVARLDHASDSPTPEEATYRVVYRFQQYSTAKTTIQGHDAYEDPICSEVEDEDHGEDAAVDADTSRAEKENKSTEECPPEVPPKSPRHGRHSPISFDARQATVLHPPTPTDKGSVSLPPRTSSHQGPSDGTDGTDGTRRPAQAANPSTTLLRESTPPSFTKPTSASKARAESRMSPDSGEKKSGLRAALKRGPGSAISNLLHKDSTSEKHAPEGQASSSKKSRQIDWPKGARATGSRLIVPKRTSSASHLSVPPQGQGAVVERPGGRDPRPYELDGAGSSRPGSRASYVSVHESKRDSLVSQTDTWSIHSRDGPGDDLRALSPAVVRKEFATHSKTVTSSQPPNNDGAPDEETGLDDSVPAKPFCPSIYTLHSRGGSSTTSLPASFRQPSAFQDAATIRRLQRTGMISETFPKFHLLRNVVRYMRFSSATYGSLFLSTMGIGRKLEKVWQAEGHLEFNVFAHHTGVPIEDILLASFVDAQGGTDSTGSTNTNVPLVHYIVVDHESKAIVLACRGTMGYEDVLTDMMCEFDELTWRRRSYRVHKGIHASARRILYGRDGRVLKQLKDALEKHEEYGLVLTGHSLGGGVTSLLGIMLAEPSRKGLGFVTSSQPHSHMLHDGRTVDPTRGHTSLPAGRPIHVYTYGPPGTMVPRLQKATRGLITSVVHGNDIVPYLSLGVLHDLQCMGLTFKSGAGELRDQIASLIWGSCHGMLSRVWYGAPAYDVRETGTRDDETAVASLKTLRASMTNQKLVPPGEVFVVETSKVLRRDAFTVDDNEAYGIGTMARRVLFKHIKDVEPRFREIRFGVHMLLDHNPARYEDALNKLYSGVAGPDES